MNNVLLKDSIETLKKIQGQLELHDDIGSSTRMELNKAINQLELYALRKSEDMKSAEIIQLIGKFLAIIPALAKLIELFSQH
jgi:hypothetical protein